MTITFTALPADVLADLDRMAPYALREELLRHDVEGSDDVGDGDAYRTAIVASLARYDPYERRDLEGSTVTIERLVPELARLVGRNKYWIGQMAVILRQDGRLISCYGAEDEFSGYSLGEIARQVARARAVRYVA